MKSLLCMIPALLRQCDPGSSGPISAFSHEQQCVGVTFLSSSPAAWRATHEKAADSQRITEWGGEPGHALGVGGVAEAVASGPPGRDQVLPCGV